MTTKAFDTQRAAGGNAIFDTQDPVLISPVTATAAWTEGSETFAMAITVAAAPAGVTGAAAWTEGSETIAITGTVEAAPITAAAAWTEGSEIFAATIDVTGASAVTASAAWTEGSDTFAMTIDVETFFARAPAGNGYSPRTTARSVRPADIQGYNR